MLPCQGQPGGIVARIFFDIAGQIIYDHPLEVLYFFGVIVFGSMGAKSDEEIIPFIFFHALADI